MEGTPTFAPRNGLYVRLAAGFSQWLRTLNFEPTSQRDMPKMLTEFLDYLERQACHEINQITDSLLVGYLTYLSQRPNRKRAGVLSENYIRKQWQVVRKFSRYLAESGQESFTVSIKIKGRGLQAKQILTQEEIALLYEATGDDTLGIRDRAMLAIYYGCGLRKKEGLELDIADLLLEKDLVYVRKGKGYRERYVPLAGRSKRDLEHYLTFGRPYLVSLKSQQALLVTVNGGRLKSPGERLQQLKRNAKISKTASLHTLRHSIASHLLHSGMSLEQIQRFLGHSSLESTQLYTHILHESL